MKLILFLTISLFILSGCSKAKNLLKMFNNDRSSEVRKISQGNGCYDRYDNFIIVGGPTDNPELWCRVAGLSSKSREEYAEETDAILEKLGHKKNEIIDHVASKVSHYFKCKINNKSFIYLNHEPLSDARWPGYRKECYQISLKEYEVGAK